MGTLHGDAYRQMACLKTRKKVKSSRIGGGRRSNGSQVSDPCGSWSEVYILLEERWGNLRIYMGKLTRSDSGSKEMTLTTEWMIGCGGLGRSGRPMRRPLCNLVTGDDSLEDGSGQERGRQTWYTVRGTESHCENNLIMTLRLSRLVAIHRSLGVPLQGKGLRILRTAFIYSASVC